jgi:hypothetical protein
MGTSEVHKHSNSRSRSTIKTSRRPIRLEKVSIFTSPQTHQSKYTETQCFLECYSVRSLVPKPFLSRSLVPKTFLPLSGEVRVVLRHFCRLRHTVIVDFGEIRAAVCMLKIASGVCYACGRSETWVTDLQKILIFSLSSHRYSYTSLLFSSRFIDS